MFKYYLNEGSRSENKNCFYSYKYKKIFIPSRQQVWQEQRETKSV